MEPDDHARLVERCLERAAAMGLTDVSVDGSGCAHVVLIDADAGIVLRFPKWGATCRRLDEIAARHRVARHTGLPVPAVLAVQGGPPGTGFLALQYMRGRFVTDLAPRASDGVLAAMGAGLARMLRQLRAVPDWPFPARDWSDMWGELVDRSLTLRGWAPDAKVDRWSALAEEAAAVAAACPQGLVHGDLASVNVLFADSGELVGVLDWDFGVVGDPAVDTAAALFEIPGPMLSAALREAPELADDLERFEVYKATWEIQDALWRMETGQDAATTPPPLDAAAR